MGIVRKFQVWVASEPTDRLTAMLSELRAGLPAIKNPMMRSGRQTRIEIVARELARRAACPVAA